MFWSFKIFFHSFRPCSIISDIFSSPSRSLRSYVVELQNFFLVLQTLFYSTKIFGISPTGPVSYLWISSNLAGHVFKLRIFFHATQSLFTGWNFLLQILETKFYSCKFLPSISGHIWIRNFYGLVSSLQILCKSRRPFVFWPHILNLRLYFKISKFFRNSSIIG
jgi:hypothetical protein